MELRTVDINTLIPYENNPRKNDGAVAAVAESIRQCGYVAPIIVDENMVVLAGHTRLKALKSAGGGQVDVIVRDGLTEEQKKKYRILDNKTNEFADWDMDALAKELEGLDFEGFDFELDLESEDEPKEMHDDEYNADPPEEPVAKRGDIYQLGRHKLMCGSCTDISEVATLMDGKIADIAFSSPPYNAGRTPSELSAGKTTKYDGNDDSKSDEEYASFLNDYIRVAKKHSEYVFMNIQSLSGNKVPLIDVLYMNKDIYADTIIWDKEHGQPAMGGNVLNSVFEYVHVFSDSAKRSIGTVEFRGTIDNIVHMPAQRKNEYSDIHNATFPVEFAGWFIERFAKESVFDSFGGTGTTMIACEQLGKTCYMMELEPKYVDVIIDRWEKLTGLKAVKLK